MPIVGQFGSLAGLGSLILPGGAMESIATVTVGSGGASSIEFVDIPSGFSHLHVRMIARTDGTARASQLTFNGTSGTSYARHTLVGSGAAASAEQDTSQAFISFGTNAISTDSASQFSATICDILDYASTSKNKTVRLVTGRDHNGSGVIVIGSGFINNTAAVTSLKVATGGGNFVQYSTAALYGIR